VTLLVHLVLLVETGRGVMALPLVDAATYHQWAQTWSRHGLPPAAFWQPPLFPVFLSLVYKVAGASVEAGRFAQMGLAVVAALLTMGLGVRLIGRKAGLAAGLAMALCGPLLFFQTQLLPVALATVLDLALVLLVIRAAERPGVGRWLLAGVALGLAGLAVPNALVMGAVALPLAWRGGETAGRRRGYAAAFLAGAVLAVGPVTLRNRVESGRWVLVSTNGAINFFIGNNSAMPVTVATRPGLDWDRLQQLPYMAGAKDAAGAERYFWGESLRFMVRTPGLFLKNLGIKTRQFFAAREIPRNLDLYTMRAHSFVLTGLTWQWEWFAFPFGLIGPLALLGMAVGWRQGRGQRVAIAFVLVYAASVILFFPAARYRAPLWPFFLVLGVGGWIWLVRQVQVPGAGWWAGVSGLALAALFVNAPVAAPSDDVRFDGELENAVGTAWQLAGRADVALAHYRKARELDPELADAAYNMGVVLTELKQRDEAKRAYREVLRIRPDHDKARVNLAIALTREGAMSEAADMLEMATVLNPRNPRAWHNRAMVLESMGRHAEALACWDEAAKLDPAYISVRNRMQLPKKEGRVVFPVD
jgi:tetratricopeptide (TPR) repeat protein